MKSSRSFPVRGPSATPGAAATPGATTTPGAAATPGATTTPSASSTPGANAASSIDAAASSAGAATGATSGANVKLTPDEKRCFACWGLSVKGAKALRLLLLHQVRRSGKTWSAWCKSNPIVIKGENHFNGRNHFMYVKTKKPEVGVPDHEDMDTTYLIHVLKNSGFPDYRSWINHVDQVGTIRNDVSHKSTLTMEVEEFKKKSGLLFRSFKKIIEPTFEPEQFEEQEELEAELRKFTNWESIFDADVQQYKNEIEELKKRLVEEESNNGGSSMELTYNDGNLGEYTLSTMNATVRGGASFAGVNLPSLKRTNVKATYNKITAKTMNTSMFNLTVEGPSSSKRQCSSFSGSNAGLGVIAASGEEAGFGTDAVLGADADLAADTTTGTDAASGAGATLAADAVSHRCRR